MQERPSHGTDRIQRLPVRLLAVCFWLLVWELASLSLHSDLLLVSPLQAVLRLLELMREPAFYRAVAGSFSRIGAGFLGGLLTGTVLAVAAARFRPVRELLAPAVLTIKSIPVASFVILVLIWFTSRRLSTVISFLMVMPTIYTGVLEGALQIDRQLEEMADVHRIPYARRLRYLRAPQIYPYLLSSCRLAIGLAWKSGIAAEVIGLPSGTIGERLQQAKIYLNTPDLFAWTMAILLLSFLTEKVFLALLRLLFGQLTRMPVQPAESAMSPETKKDAGILPAPSLRLSSLYKTYGDTVALDSLSAEAPAGVVSCVMGPSGAGKTTLLRLIAGLEQPDSGTITRLPEAASAAPLSMVFQEDRLVEDLSVLSNLRLTSPSLTEERASQALRSMDLPGELLHRPVRTLSGGMKRRVSLLRALLTDSRLLLLDEPFTGLDDRTREIVLHGLPALAEDRTVLLVTHDPADAAALHAPVISL